MEDCTNFFLEVAQSLSIRSVREKYKDFDALCTIDNMLLYIAQNRISPESPNGKHVKVDLEEAIKVFTDSFKEKGINLHFSIDWNLE